MSAPAEFNENDHAVVEGWATFHRRKPMFRFRLRCWLGHHVLPAAPTVRNGYSPSNTGRCSRCLAFLNWYVRGQHRYGGYADDSLRAPRCIP